MKNRVLLFIIIILIVFGSSGFLVYKILYSDSDKPVVVVKLASEIDGWNYSLDERDSKIMVNEFNNLKNILNSDEIDYEEYASTLAKLYIIDMYTINNKINIYDLPCLEYIYPDNESNFKIKLENTLYLYLKDNSDGKRNQVLPEVSNINVDNIKATTFRIGSESFDAYEVSLSWEYVTDLGYDDNCILTLVKKDNKLYVAKQEINDQSSSS